MPPKSKKKTPAALKKTMREIIDLDLEREELERVAHEKQVVEETEKTEKKAAGNYDYLLRIYSKTKL
jgi:regulator of replication initiation timing